MIRIYLIFYLLSFAIAGTLNAAKFQKIHVEDGVLLFEDGSELNLWGVNYQPSMSWEFSRMARHGLHNPFDLNAYKAMIDEGFDELELLECNLIRIHLAPGDFTDQEGNLVNNAWLDLTDYVLAEAEKRGIYTYLAFLNTLGAARGKETFISNKDSTKPVWMVDPSFKKKAENFIRQMLNRENKYIGDVKYKDSPALAIVEPINEPGYFTRESIETYPSCLVVYRDWLVSQNLEDSEDNYTSWRIANTTSYINEMVRLFKAEGVGAPMSWSMEWPRMMTWTGEDVFQAAAESDAEVLSVCLYPGQSASYKKKGEELKAVGEINYLNYLKKAYSRREWNGWMREERFQNKARIVYEFETYYNQSSYMYPAMAKYFRSQGIQAAAMWTYILPGQADYTSAAHNLNLKTTPHKAASFIAAGKVMRSQDRYGKFDTSTEVDDYFKNTALSYTEGCSAYADDNTLVYSENMPEEFCEHLLKDQSFKQIIGRGNSPYVSYSGTGLYFVEKTEEGTVIIRILPDAKFLNPHYLRNERGEKAVELSVDNNYNFELRLPGTAPVRFKAKPGKIYTIRK